MGVFENRFTEGSEGVLNLELLCYILFDLDDGLIEENALISYTAKVIFFFFFSGAGISRMSREKTDQTVLSLL